MKVLLLVYSTLFISHIHGYINPFTNSYKSDTSSSTITVPITSNYAGLPNYTSTHVAPASIKTTTHIAPQPVATQHTHQISSTHNIVPTLNTSFPPTYVPAPIYTQTKTAPTTPQNLSFQQIIQYLFSNSGQGLDVLFQKGAKNFMSQCKAYCNALPSDPVCDTTNTLYRNRCELDCLGRDSNSNLRFGLCCCTAADNNIAVNSNRIVYDTSDSSNNVILCITPCIDTCLGGLSEFDIDDSQTLVLDTTDNSCGTPGEP